MVRSGADSTRHNHGVLTNGDLESEKRYDQTKTLQYYLSNAGYRTVLVGKYWNKWPLFTRPPYFQRSAAMRTGYTDVEFVVDGVRRTIPGYSTDVVGNLAVDYLEGMEGNDAQPWFLYVAPHAPHSPFTPEGSYQEAPVPAWQRTPAVLESDRSDKPPIVRSITRSLSFVRQISASQLRTLMSVDDMVGQLFGAMDRLGEQDTVAFYVSDNGYLG